MSKDNGIYILATRSEENKNFIEYRVVHAHAIDNIYGDTSDQDNPSPNREMIKEYFGEAKPFTKEDEAVEEAFRIYDSVGRTEFGIGVIYAWENYTFTELIGE